MGQLIDKVQREVGDGTARIRWVRVSMGCTHASVPGPDAGGPRPAARDAADALARAVAPFEVHLSGGGAFPSLARPRSLWVGVREGADRLANLADALTAAAGECGLFLDTRPFAPHLTIGRTDGVRLGPVAARASSTRQTASTCNSMWTGSCCSEAFSAVGRPATSRFTRHASRADPRYDRDP